MTSPRYYDVTHFLTNLNENCTTYVKLKIKDILFGRIFRFSEYLFIEKITINYENHVNCPVTLHLPRDGHDFDFKIKIINPFHALNKTLIDYSLQDVNFAVTSNLQLFIY